MKKSKGPGIDLLDYDPIKFGRQEVKAWRYYYEHSYVKMALAVMSSASRKIPFFSRVKLAYFSGVAAREFKKDEDNVNEEKVAKYLEKFFAVLDDISVQSFDSIEVAKLEFDWWKEHRENGYYKPTKKLVDLLAKMIKVAYSVSDSQAHEYAEKRAQAMCLRHKESNEGTVTDEEWSQIEKLVQDAWAALQS